jgi:hypothetical protein
MILKENLDELQQTVLLMQTEDGNEYFDSAVRNRKFGRVDPLNGPRILEKYVSFFSSYSPHLPVWMMGTAGWEMMDGCVNRWWL